MVKILHTADFHIGASFSSFDDSQRAINLQFKAIFQMVHTANLQNIDIILIAGDVFDNLDVEFSLRKKTFDILEKFNGKIFIVCGNHDYYFNGSFWGNTPMPSNVFLFKTNVYEAIEFENFCVFGASFTNIYDKISFEDIKIVENKINIGIVHADILNNSQYNALSKEMIKESNLDYLAVGHNHKFSEILSIGKTNYASSGNICATSVDEVGEKGYIIAEFTKDGKKISFVESAGVQIFDIEIDISTVKTNEEVFAKILSYASINYCVKVNLVGICYEKLDINGILEKVEDEFFSIKIIDNTEDPENLWKYLNQDNLLGEFSRLMRVKYDENPSKEVIGALKLGIDALIF